MDEKRFDEACEYFCEQSGYDTIDDFLEDYGYMIESIDDYFNAYDLKQSMDNLYWDTIGTRQRVKKHFKMHTDLYEEELAENPDDDEPDIPAPEQTIKYSLTTIVDGVPTTIEFTAGEEINLNDLEIDGFNFLGWYYNEEKVTFPFNIDKDTVLDAKFEPQEGEVYIYKESDGEHLKIYAKLLGNANIQISSNESGMGGAKNDTYTLNEDIGEIQIANVTNSRNSIAIKYNDISIFTDSGYSKNSTESKKFVAKFKYSAGEILASSTEVFYNSTNNPISLICYSNEISELDNVNFAIDTTNNLLAIWDNENSGVSYMGPVDNSGEVIRYRGSPISISNKTTSIAKDTGLSYWGGWAFYLTNNWKETLIENSAKYMYVKVKNQNYYINVDFESSDLYKITKEI